MSIMLCLWKCVRTRRLQKLLVALSVINIILYVYLNYHVLESKQEAVPGDEAFKNFIIPLPTDDQPPESYLASSLNVNHPALRDHDNLSSRSELQLLPAADYPVNLPSGKDSPEEVYNSFKADSKFKISLIESVESFRLRSESQESHVNGHVSIQLEVSSAVIPSSSQRAIFSVDNVFVRTSTSTQNQTIVNSSSEILRTPDIQSKDLGKPRIQIPGQSASITAIQEISHTPDIQPKDLSSRIGTPDQSITAVEENITRRAESLTSTNNENTTKRSEGISLPITTVQPMTQHDLDSMAANMKVRFEFLQHSQGAHIHFQNHGLTPIESNGWAVVSCVVSGIGISRTSHTSSNKIVLPGNRMISLSHINGCLYKAEPSEYFESILPGNSLTFAVQTGTRMARSDVAPRWYVTAHGLEPRTIANTANEELDFVFPPKRRLIDRYEVNNIMDLGKAPLFVIPTPLEIYRSGTKMLLVTDEWTVAKEPGLEQEADYLTAKLNLKESSSPNTESKIIRLSRGNVSMATASNESYYLQVDASKEVIYITGEGEAGVFYGVQTLLALLNDNGEMPELSVKDAPRFSYRGLMVDVGRNFIPKIEILKILDVMAMYKMNKFHFHLSDNEGWRLEIPGLEELTSVGSKRCHDLQEKTCIISQLGSGPDTSTSGTGFYTTTEYLEILRYAKQRHIQVIPEFDFPGHSHAAIKSMIVRHDRLVQEGSDLEAKRFLLNDVEDQSRYVSVQSYTDEAANPCLNSTYSFIERVLTALRDLHSDIQPLNVYHFGGDEVPSGAWRRSPACLNFAKKLNLQYNDIHTHQSLKEHFMKRLSNITRKLDLSIGGWGDFLFDKHKRSILGKEFFLNKDVYAFVWSPSAVSKKTGDVSIITKNGYKVVLSTPDYVYLDHPYEPDPEERGKNWAAPFIDTRKIHSYAPGDLHTNTDNNRTCNASNACVDGRQNVLGVEAAFWGETVRTSEQLNYMLFPRLLALAERAWHKASWEELSDKRERGQEKTKDWEKFANTLGYKELARLDKTGVAYRVPPPGARILQGKLKTRAALPGLTIEYSTDEGVTWNAVAKETEVIERIKLRTRSADDQRVSREVDFEPPNPTSVTAETESNDEKPIEIDSTTKEKTENKVDEAKEMAGLNVVPKEVGEIETTVTDNLTKIKEDVKGNESGNTVEVPIEIDSTTKENKGKESNRKAGLNVVQKEVSEIKTTATDNLAKTNEEVERNESGHIESDSTKKETSENKGKESNQMDGLDVVSKEVGEMKTTATDNLAKTNEELKRNESGHTIEIPIAIDSTAK